ncbi:GNAT family N-acetyltransferase [Kribbella sp. NBC_01505]|uniref:GNAT family N-acetyltransferase n=1 Tax=Kribbella sp. NBC_01505 TaxID=2903580 RepID=UPI00386B4840
MRERVLKAAAEWVWVPDDAEDIVADDYRLIVYSRGPVVQWSSTTRPLEVVHAEMRERIPAGTRLRWWVDAQTQPANTAEFLQGKGFTEVEDLEILARPISAELTEELAVPEDVVVRQALDAETIERAALVDSEVFDWPPPSRNELDSEAATIARGDLLSQRFVAELDGEVVGSAGYRLMGDTVGLWGGGVLAKARGRGVYRALIAARCEIALAAGADLALVSARVTTSAPILRRIGFVAYGTKRCYEL